MNITDSIRARLAVAIAITIAMTGQLQAADFIYLPGVGNDYWQDGDWTTPGIPNSTADRAIFNASANPSYSTNTHPSPDPGPYVINEMVFDTSSDWRLHNAHRDLSLSSGGGGALFTQTGSGTVTLDIDLELADNTIFQGNGSGAVTINGSPGGTIHGVFGGGSLTKQGNYDLILNALSEHTGNIIINNGIVRATVGHNDTNALGALGDASIIGRKVQVNTGSTLQLQASHILGGAESMPALTLEIKGGTVTNNGNFFNTLGPVTLDGGVLTATGGSAAGYQAYRLFGDISVTGTTPSTISATGSNSNYHLHSATTFNVEDVTSDSLTDLTIDASFRNQTDSQGAAAGALVKTGAGTMLMTRDSSYTGGTTIKAGTIKLSNPNTSDNGRLGATNYAPTAVQIESGGALDTNGTGTQDIKYGLTIAGDGPDGNGAFVNTGNHASLNKIQTPNITLSDDASIGGTGNTAQISPGYGPNTLDLAGHTLTKRGTNTHFLTNTTISTGTVHIAEGKISQNRQSDGSAADFSLADAAGVSLELNGRNFSAGSLAGGGTTGGSVSLGGNNLTIGRNGAPDTAFAGQITGTGNVTKVGDNKITLTNVANSWSGGIALNGGTIETPQLAAGGISSPIGAATNSAANLSFDGGTLAYTGPTITGVDRSFTVNAAGGTIDVTDAATTLALTDAAISGSGTFTKEGPGTLVLDPAGSDQHGTTGNVNVNNGMLHLNGAQGFNNGQFASPTTFTVTNGAELRANDAWTLKDSDTVTINDGTLTFGNDNYLNNLNLSGAAVNTTGGGQPWRVGNWAPGIVTTTGDIQSTINSRLTFVGTGAGPTATFNVADGAADTDLEMNGQIYDHGGFGGAMRFIKTGAGKMTLTNTSNSWDGGMSINGGTISVSQLTAGNVNGQLGGWSGTAPFFSFDGGTLEYTGGNVSGINRAFEIKGGGATIAVTNPGTALGWSSGAGAGPITGTGGLTKTGDGRLLLPNANTYTGGTTINAGTLHITDSGAIGNGTLTMNGGRLRTNINLANPITLNSTANTISPDDNYRALTGKLSGLGGFTLTSGGGTPGLYLTNTANDFAGDITISGNTYLRTGASEVIPDTASIVNNGHLRLDISGGGTETISGLTGNGEIWIPTSNDNNHTLAVGAGNATSTYAGRIGRSGQNNAYLALTKVGSGTLTLTGSNLHENGTTVNGGTLEITNVASLPSVGAINVNNGGELRLAVGGQPFNSVGGIGSGNPLMVNAGGTVTLAEHFNAGYNRPIVLDGGTLNITALDGGAGDGSNYVNNLTMRNGAQATGNLIRVGHFGPSQIVVDGTSASTISSGINLVNASNSHTFDVSNATEDSAADLTVSGPIRDFTGLAGTPVIKTGNGTLSLSGPTSYSGDTSITNGMLLVNGTHSGLGTFTVDAGAKLGGTGTIAGTVINNGIFSPGNSPGTNSVGTLVLNGPYQWEIFDAGAGAAGANAWDHTTITTELTINAGGGIDVLGLSSLTGPGDVAGLPLNLDVYSIGATTGPFEILTFAAGATLNGGIPTPADILSIPVTFGNLGQYGTFASSLEGTTDTLFLTFTSTVPEPGTWALFGLLLAAGIAYTRRRQAA